MKMTKEQLMEECEVLLVDIDRRQPGGRGRHHLDVKLRLLLDRIVRMEENIKMIYVAMAVAFLLLSTSYAFAADTEPPEPTEVTLTCDTAEDFEISWHGGTWTKVIPADWLDADGISHPAYEFISGEPSTNHIHITGLGTRVFEAAGPEPGQKVIFGIPIEAIPDDVNGSRWWGIMRVRWRCRTFVDVDGATQAGPVFDWSPTSWWVLVIDTKSLGRPR